MLETAQLTLPPARPATKSGPSQPAVLALVAGLIILLAGGVPWLLDSRQESDPETGQYTSLSVDDGPLSGAHLAPANPAEDRGLVSSPVGPTIEGADVGDRQSMVVVLDELTASSQDTTAKVSSGTPSPSTQPSESLAGSAGAGGGPTVTIVGGADLSVGDDITVEWANGSSAATSWIGVFSAGAPDTAYRQRTFTNGAAEGMMRLVEDLPAGPYEVRMFADDGYELLAETTMNVG